MKLKGLWGALMVLVAMAASSCDEEQSAPLPEPTPATVRATRQEVKSTRKVLILSSTVEGGTASHEARAALALPGTGWTVDLVSPAQWKTLTAEQFMGYRLLVIGDPGCTTGEAAFQAAIETKAKWGAIVDGKVVIIGSNPASNSSTPAPDIDPLVLSAMDLASDRPDLTGMYVALGCAYKNAPPETAVSLLSPFGDFKVAGVDCAAEGHRFLQSPGTISDNVFDGVLIGQDGCSARSVFTTYPDHDFAMAALAVDTDGSMPGSLPHFDYDDQMPYSGTAFILTRGAMSTGLGCGGDGNNIPTGQECDLGDGGNGQPSSQTGQVTCSWSCKSTWCGDGVIQAELGEECDLGNKNRRGTDAQGSIGTCNGMCRIPNIPPEPKNPPVAVCKDVTVRVTNVCGANADINNGSSDPDNDLVGCTQSPAGSYNIGVTAVTLTCTDATNKTATCTGNVTVEDGVVPTIALSGAATEALECGSAYTDRGATANDLCSGDMTSQIAKTGSVNPNAPATYTVSYDVTDAAGNSPDAVTRTVTVSDTLKPAIALNGLSNQALECGTPYNEQGATANDQCAGNITSKIVKSGTVNHAAPGTYPVRYNVTDNVGLAADEVSRIVTVRDTLMPTVTMNGTTPMTHECGAAFNDPGATASDVCAGNLPTVPSRTVPVQTRGGYDIYYRATDPSGNTGVTATARRVTVVDTLAPAVTLKGNSPMALECGTAFVDPGANATDQCSGTLTPTMLGTVNNKVPGSYTRTYRASDAVNFTTTVTRTVNVTDTQAPTVTISGAPTIAVECGNTYADPGATANDACAGALTATANPVVNPNQPQTYNVRYSATDPSGNVGQSTGTRTVTVSDTQAPVLTLNGAATAGLECGTPYNDPGATANDKCVGDLTAQISKTGSVNHMAPGSYPLGYTVSDGTRSSSATRTVTVSDTLAPTVTMTGAPSIAVECGSTYADPGATANDACAGTLSAVPSRVVNPNAPNTYTINYSATDPSGNTGVAAGSRTVTVSDTLEPTLTLNGAATQALECGTPFNDPGATANDQCAGVLTVTRTGGVNHQQPASYQLGYSATDGKFTKTASRTVNVEDTLAPQLTVLGAPTDQYECGSTYVDPGATAADACEGNLTAAIVATQTGNPAQPGQFSITYSVTDQAGHIATAANARTVTVNDNQPPTLVLLGNATASLECGSTYNDPGARAEDVCFGDVSSRIVRNGSVNTGAPGSYTLTFNVTDPAGQSAPAVNRTVTVSDTQSPIVTVVGPLTQTLECGDGTYTDPGATANDSCAGALAAVPSTVVDQNAPRNYTITYSATDPSGNTGTSATSRSVTVADTRAPVLTLRPAPAGVECGTPFNDPGATANDLCRGDLSAAISRTGSVDHQQTGNYQLTYNVTDGQHPISATRSVSVNDTLAPAITVLGSANDSFECGSTYLDPGATAADVCAGNLTAAIVATQRGNPAQPGSFQIDYSVTDPAGNTRTVTGARTVTVNDNAPPVLALNGPGSLGLECGDAYTEQGARANDACFGDVTSRIVIGGSVNTAAPGSYTRTYNVTDQAGQSAPQLTRSISVSDTVPPAIAVLGPLSQTFECGSGPYNDPGASALDSCAGDVSSRIVRAGSVNGGAAGQYTLSYSVTDPSGNSATAANSRTVTVTDTSVPVLSLVGPAVQGFECGTPYADPGATANDACAGDLTSAIVRTGSVASGAAGSYTLTYNVTDPSGLSATPVSRRVDVSDSQAPTLALVGPATQLVECGSQYADPGAQATDLCAGDLTAAIVRGGSVNPAAVGPYTVTYNVADPSGNAAPQLSRGVTVRDTLVPEITVLGPAAQKHECGSTYMDPGATANDQCAGDLTAAIVSTRSGNANAPGTFEISYSVTDPSGNSVTSPVKRTVTVDDNQAPVLALNGPATVGLECGTPYNDLGASANDACFGDLTAAIVKSGTVNVQRPGSYPVVYNVTDPAGQSATSVSRTVNVSDTLLPTITVLGALNETFECGTTYQDPGATANDTCAGDLTANVVATRTPVAGQPGTTSISYSVTDPSGNTATSAVSRTVRMIDEVAPVVTLNGRATDVKECGTPYVDPGATANDSCVGPLQVTVAGAVDHTTAGSYTLTYSAMDLVGNTDSKTRTVAVTDTQGPAIVVNGDNPMKLECKRDTYVELGATATDLCSGAEDVTVSGTVDNTKRGFNLITYAATDNSGNANSTVRNVLVDDTLGPTMELNGPNPMVLECALGNLNNDLLAKATDLCEGDVSASVFREFTNLDINKVGDYFARYQGQDSVGHVAQINRDLQVVDTTAPVLAVVNEGETIECGTQPSLGVTATDACYGPVPVIANPSSIPSEPGVYEVTYSAVDPAGNIADGSGAVTRTITVEDTTDPVLSIADQDVFYECTGYAIGNVWNAPEATATDSCEGSIPVHQYNTGDDDEDGVPGSIDPDDFGPGPTTEVEGLYYVQYLAWDETYNIQGAILSVYVRDTIKPVLFLNPDNDEGDPAYEQVECFLPRGTEPDPNPYVNPGASAEDQCYGDLNQEVVHFGEVNKQIPGTYSLSYQVRDGAYNWADEVSRTVEVVDSLQPVLVDRQTRLTPVDDTMRIVELSQCAEAQDQCEGYMAINTYGEVVAITSSEPDVDGDGDIVFTPGESTFRLRSERNGTAARVYTVTYKVTDSSGNEASANCTVNIPGAQPIAPSRVMGDGTMAAR